ncbi:MAG: tol-pal system protein YbgF [Sandaracinaceae bacterium]|nr:tol-pal system protein YbgF [Sandaracinaceae bacterium]
MTRLQLALALLLALASGCASASSSGASGTTPAAAEVSDEARIAALEAERLRQDEEIRALRNELAIVRGEADTLRNAQASARVATISIRSGTPAATDESGRSSTDLTGTSQGDPGAGWIEPEAGEVVVEEPGPSDSRPRPVLRVRGVPTPAAPTMTIPSGESPPSFASGSGLPPLPTAGPVPVAPLPLPAQSAAGAPPSFAPSAGPLAASVASGGTMMVPVAPEPLTTVAPDTAVIAYRAALGHLRDRQYPEAVDAFDSFLRTHANHPYVANAHYWRAEAIYAQRRYRDALHAFEVFVQRHGSHTKVADALLKMGLCHARSGDTARARAMFRRVQQEYPDTVAARLASREEAS